MLTNIPKPVTGDNGTIDGQGSIWWDSFNSNTLNYSRPHIVEFVSSKDIVISNITFLNSPAWTIHPVYCRYYFILLLVYQNNEIKYDLTCSFLCLLYSNVLVQNITALSPSESPYTSGIVPGTFGIFSRHYLFIL